MFNIRDFTLLSTVSPTSRTMHDTKVSKGIINNYYSLCTAVRSTIIFRWEHEEQNSNNFNRSRFSSTIVRIVELPGTQNLHEVLIFRRVKRTNNYMYAGKWEKMFSLTLGAIKHKQKL